MIMAHSYNVGPEKLRCSRHHPTSADITCLVMESQSLYCSLGPLYDFKGFAFGQFRQWLKSGVQKLWPFQNLYCSQFVLSLFIMVLYILKISCRPLFTLLSSSSWTQGVFEKLISNLKEGADTSGCGFSLRLARSHLRILYMVVFKFLFFGLVVNDFKLLPKRGC